MTSDNIEYYKQEVLISCKNMFTVAVEALQNKPSLVKVVIMEHAPRSDELCMDPVSLKPALATFANATFNHLWMESPWKSKIIIGAHNLQCSERTRITRFTDDKTKRYDGVHMYSESGKRAFTRSLINIFTQVVRLPHVDVQHGGDQIHRYSIPVHNMFNILGN